MTQPTSRQRRAAKPSSSARAKIARSSVSGKSAPKKRRVDPNASNYVIAGAVILIIGLGFAVGLAMTAPGPGEERALAIYFIPWIVALGGLALSAIGFMRMPPAGCKT